MNGVGGMLLTVAVTSIASVGLWNLVALVLKRKWSVGDRQRKSHEECLREVEALKERVAIIEHHHNCYLARWIKDADRRVIWFNAKAMLAIFGPLGKTREEVLGKTFAELLLDPVASAEIDRLDEAALAHPECAAHCPIRLHPNLPVMIVVKVAAVGREGELVFEGYAYRTNDSLITAGFGADRQRLAIAASAMHKIDGAAGD